MGGFPTPAPTWNLWFDLRLLLQYPFMVQAFRAGIVVAVLAAVIGWFMVLRRQSFAGHTLAVVGFPGATAAALLGASPALGFVATGAAAAAIIARLPAGLAARRVSESALIGTVQAVALALGYLAYSWYGGFASSIESMLFGSFLGITTGQVWFLMLLAGPILLIMAVIGRPLYFASVDPGVAASRGVPVRALDTVFLLLLGITAGAVSQITGALLVFALLVAPPATAQWLTSRPGRSVLLSVLLSTMIMLASLSLAYFIDLPLGTYVTTLALMTYVAARMWHR